MALEFLKYSKGIQNRKFWGFQKNAIHEKYRFFNFWTDSNEWYLIRKLLQNENFWYAFCFDRFKFTPLRGGKPQILHKMNFINCIYFPILLNFALFESASKILFNPFYFIFLSSKLRFQERKNSEFDWKKKFDFFIYGPISTNNTSLESSWNMLICSMLFVSIRANLRPWQGEVPKFCPKWSIFSN